MAITYPTTLDAFTSIGVGDTEATSVGGRTHRGQHNDANAAIVAIETELGVLVKGGSATLAARLTALDVLVAAVAQYQAVLAASLYF